VAEECNVRIVNAKREVSENHVKKGMLYLVGVRKIN
jgi:hypothetical protein